MNVFTSTCFAKLWLLQETLWILHNNSLEIQKIIYWCIQKNIQSKIYNEYTWVGYTMSTTVPSLTSLILNGFSINYHANVPILIEWTFYFWISFDKCMLIRLVLIQLLDICSFPFNLTSFHPCALIFLFFFACVLFNFYLIEQTWHILYQN